MWQEKRQKEYDKKLKMEVEVETIIRELPNDLIVRK